VTTPRVLPPTVLAMRERDVERFVIDCAKQFGLARYHTHRSDYSPAGWPDEALCRPPRLVLAELKGETGKKLRQADLSVKQAEWIELLRACETRLYGAGVEVYVWGPAQVRDGTIERILR
jgi:hypothetical protein